MKRPLLTLLLAGLTCASCNNSPTTPTTTTRTTQYFTGILNPGESKFYSFNVSVAGNTDLTLLSVLPASAATPALNVGLTLGIGTPAGTGCRTSTTVATPPALAPQLVIATTPTTYCAQIADTGQLTTPVQFVVVIAAL